MIASEDNEAKTQRSTLLTALHQRGGEDDQLVDPMLRTLDKGGLLLDDAVQLRVEDGVNVAQEDGEVVVSLQHGSLLERHQRARIRLGLLECLQRQFRT